MSCSGFKLALEAQNVEKDNARDEKGCERRDAPPIIQFKVIIEGLDVKSDTMLGGFGYCPSAL